jgi:hypothetical protein
LESALQQRLDFGLVLSDSVIRTGKIRFPIPSPEGLEFIEGLTGTSLGPLQKRCAMGTI